MDKMKQLLLDWEFDDSIIENFVRHKVTEDLLEKLSDAYIDQLIPAIGDRLKFIDHRKQYLKSRPRKSNDKKSFDAKEIIERSEAGSDICALYEIQEFLRHEQRMKVIDIILDEVFEKKIKLSRKEKDFDDIANQILTVFPNESKSEYFEHHRGGQPTGLLYEKYFQRLNAKKKNKNEGEVPLQDQFWNCLMEEGVLESIEYLKDSENDNKDLLRRHWEKTFKVRRLKIKMSNKFDETLHDWPHLRKPIGVLMIEHDFTEEHGEECARILRMKWSLFFEKNFSGLYDAIRDIRAKNKFRSMEHEENLNLKNVTLALSLHYLVPPSKTTTESSTWTPTIPDSKNSFFKLVTKSSMKREIEIRSKIRSMKTIDHHPMIYGIGASLEEIEEFAVVISDVSYFHIETFIEALDISFKMFSVFQLKFPPESGNFWIFLNEVFFKINIEYKSCPKLKSLLTNFKM